MNTAEFKAQLSDAQKAARELKSSDLMPMEILEEILRRKQSNRITKYFPETGPLRRELYVKHMEHLEAGRLHDERLFLAANKVGKSLVGGLETAYHATGKYPAWWKGKVFEHPINGWICNNTAIDTRDINQQILLGDAGQFGTGLIPKADLIDWKAKPSVPDGVELIYIRHVSGGQSVITTKAYEQGRTKFQGRNIHLIWADEEIPADVYGECMLRLMVTGGIMYCTYTPVLGLTPITVAYLSEAVNKESLPFKFDKSQFEKQQNPNVRAGL